MKRKEEGRKEERYWHQNAKISRDGRTHLDAVGWSSSSGWRPLTTSSKKRRAGEAEISSSDSAGMVASARTKALKRKRKKCCALKTV